MPLQSRFNLFVGINAHLHSLFQTGDGWSSFHATYLVYLTSALQEVLQPLGYEADVEPSLQIRRLDDPPRLPRADVLLYDTDPVRAAAVSSPMTAATAEMVLSLTTMLAIAEEDAPRYRAVGIYRLTSPRRTRGEPVAWIELLSPSNKPGGQDFETYRIKREALLQTGLVFVELDYLHHSPPTFAGVPVYDADPNSYPFRLTVIDPRPEFLSGQGRTRGFAVDEPIPSMPIPLNADDVLTFDFDPPYQRTFYEMFYGNRVDYAQLPPAFERYSLEDRARIVNRMLTIAEMVRAGQPLQPPHPPASTFALSEALDRLANT
jgi:hypothetical protein